MAAGSGAAVDMFHQIGRAGYFAVGFSSRAFLKIERPRGALVSAAQLADEYEQILAHARRALGLDATTTRAVLTGWSRGAAFSVLVGLRAGGAAHPVLGVIAIGLAEGEDLQITGAEDETDDGPASPATRRWPFDTYARIARLGPLPCAVIQATHDNYLPAARARQLFGPDTPAATVLRGRGEESSIFRREGRVRRSVSRRDSVGRVAARTTGWRRSALRLRKGARSDSDSGTRMIAALANCRTCLIALTIGCVLMADRGVAGPRPGTTLVIRGHAQSLHLYGTRGGPPVIVSSGDGGWMHLGPHVAETLAAKGFFVVGFDVRAYLESFTSGGRHAAARRTNRATTRCSPISPRGDRRRSRF